MFVFCLHTRVFKQKYARHNCRSLIIGFETPPIDTGELQLYERLASLLPKTKINKLNRLSHERGDRPRKNYPCNKSGARTSLVITMVDSAIIFAFLPV